MNIIKKICRNHPNTWVASLNICRMFQCHIHANHTETIRKHHPYGLLSHTDNRQNMFKLMKHPYKPKSNKLCIYIYIYTYVYAYIMYTYIYINWYNYPKWNSPLDALHHHRPSISRAISEARPRAMLAKLKAMALYISAFITSPGQTRMTMWEASERCGSS